MERYKGKPFLRLIECYILDSIYQLDDNQKKALEAMEPKLRILYKSDSDWKTIISEQMNFPDSFPEKIRSLWSNYLSQAKINSLSVDPNEFAILFTNTNFPDFLN